MLARLLTASFIAYVSASSAAIAQAPILPALAFDVSDGETQSFVSEDIDAVIRNKPEAFSARVELDRIATKGDSQGYVALSFNDAEGKNSLLLILRMEEPDTRYTLLISNRREDGRGQRPKLVLTENDRTSWPPTIRLTPQRNNSTIVGVGYYTTLVKHGYALDNLVIAVSGASGTITFGHTTK